MSLAAVLAAAYLVAWACTHGYRRWALRVGRIDVPGARSSHASATPTGGGAGIVAGCAAALALTAFTVGAGLDWLLAFALALVLAAMGFADDRRALPALPRLLGQLAAAAALLGFVAMRAGPAGGVDALLLAVAAGSVLLVWLTNAFNFMDGIDGIAGSQALFMAGCAALLAGGAGGGDTAHLLGGIAAAALGFLMLNWPPARIFMGDTGSQPLGFLLGAAGAVTVARGELQWTTWAILWALFVADATITLAHRALRRQPLLKAHRDHAYQRLARRRGSHAPVTAACAALNLLWLLPLAALAQHLPRFGPLLVLLAYVPVCCAVLLVLRHDAHAGGGGNVK